MTASLRDADGRFQVTASEELFRGNIFSVRRDTVVMPGGGVASRDVVDHLLAVAVVAVDDDGRVVLIEQYRHPLRRRLWEVPAGLMDIADEDALVCAQRELLEEAALAADRWTVLLDIATSPGFSTEAIRIYLATGLRAASAPAAQDEEIDLRVQRVPLQDAVRGVLRGEIINGPAVAGLLAAERLLLDVGDEPIAVAARQLPPAETGWTHSEALINRSDLIGDAPELTGTGGQET